MITTLDDTRVKFNDTQLQILFSDLFPINDDITSNTRIYNYGLIAVSVDSEQVIPFAASKNISTTRAMYKQQDIITAIDGESLSFSITFAPVRIESNTRMITPIPWSNEMWNLLYRTLDVKDYKPLIFGNPDRRLFTPIGTSRATTYNRADYVSRPYYNCVPLVGSVSELKMFADSSGYVTIPFVCDAPHMWIDVAKTYIRNADTRTVGWVLPNFTNVKNYSSGCYTEPMIEIFQITSSSFAEHGYVSFRNSEDSDDWWFRMYGFPLSDSLNKITIDNDNKMIYGFNNEDNEVVLNDVNYIQYLTPIRFFYLDEEAPRALDNISGGKTVYHRTLVGDTEATSYYTIRFTYSCPYMGGNDDDMPTISSIDDRYSVLSHPAIIANANYYTENQGAKRIEKALQGIDASKEGVQKVLELYNTHMETQPESLVNISFWGQAVTRAPQYIVIQFYDNNEEQYVVGDEYDDTIQGDYYTVNIKTGSIVAGDSTIPPEGLPYSLYLTMQVKPDSLQEDLSWFDDSY